MLHFLTLYAFFLHVSKEFCLFCLIFTWMYQWGGGGGFYTELSCKKCVNEKHFQSKRRTLSSLYFNKGDLFWDLMEIIQMTVHLHCCTHCVTPNRNEMLPDRKDWSASILPGIKKKKAWLLPDGLVFLKLSTEVIFYPTTPLKHSLLSFSLLAVWTALLSAETLLNVSKWPSWSGRFRSVKVCVGGCGCSLVCVCVCRSWWLCSVAACSTQSDISKICTSSSEMSS